jgi:indole-3-glycerol phosphate synthase
LQPVNGRRFSQAVSEGDGISVIAEVDGADAARRAEAEGAEAVLVDGRVEGRIREIGGATSLPILFPWSAECADELAGVDACIVTFGDSGTPGDEREDLHVELADDFELALRVNDEEQLAEALERFDPEIVVLAGSGESGEEALERVLELLADVPAGKLAIADLPVSSRDEVLALERAGVDGVIVRTGNIAELVGSAPPAV